MRLRITLPRWLRRAWIALNTSPSDVIWADEAERRFQLGSATESRSTRRDADAIVIAARNRPVLVKK